jgi:MYXO-CTERM domain-containing protein
MNQTIIRVLAGLAMTLLLAGPAAADVPPEPGYIEKCTVANYAKKGIDCQSCGAWHGDRDACVNTLGKKGYEKKCQTRGASTWSEIWCGMAKVTPLDTPAVDKPVVDKPVVDTPVVDTPVVDTPVVDTPVVDIPVVDKPVVDKPVEGKSGETPTEVVAEKKKGNCNGSGAPVGWTALALIGLAVIRRRDAVRS